MRLSGTIWYLASHHLNPRSQEKFASFEKIFALQGERITSDILSRVYKLTIENKQYYLKRYHAPGKGIRRYLGKSRIRREWENLLLLNKIGLPTPKIIAYGQQRDQKGIMQGFLMTEAVTDTIDLEQYIRSQPERLQDKEKINSIINQVADYTRKMHDAKFIHKDLNWRNILVKTQGKPEIFFIDCPSGAKQCGLSLKRGKLRDLAHLDKVGRQLLSKSQQLRFYLRYQQIDKLSPKDKVFIEQIVHFHDKHRERKRQRQLLQNQ